MNNQEVTSIVRWTVVGIVFVAFFWICWSLFAGSIPVVGEGFGLKWVTEMKISRLWTDLLFVPIFVVLVRVLSPTIRKCWFYKIQWFNIRDAGADVFTAFFVGVILSSTFTLFLAIPLFFVVLGAIWIVLIVVNSVLWVFFAGTEGIVFPCLAYLNAENIRPKKNSD